MKKKTLLWVIIAGVAVAIFWTPIKNAFDKLKAKATAASSGTTV